MIPPLRNWRPQHLLGAWTTYWVGLVGVTLGPAMLKIWQVTQNDAAKSSVTAGFDGGNLRLDVLTGTTPVWAGTASVMSVAMLIAIPPLLLWVVWLFARPARTPDEPHLLTENRDFSPSPLTSRDKMPQDRSPSTHHDRP